MRETKAVVFIHLVWTTWDRLPLLAEDIRPVVFRAIGAKCAALGAEVVAIGGVEDHVHLLMRLPSTVTLADLVGQAKGASAHLMTHQVRPGQPFKWQGSYGAFSVSPGHLSQVIDYISHQLEHHAAGTLVPEWEPTSPPQGSRDAAVPLPGKRSARP